MPVLARYSSALNGTHDTLDSAPPQYLSSLGINVVISFLGALAAAFIVVFPGLCLIKLSLDRKDAADGKLLLSQTSQMPPSPRKNEGEFSFAKFCLFFGYGVLLVVLGMFIFGIIVTNSCTTKTTKLPLCVWQLWFMSVLFFRAAVCKIDPAVAFLCRILIYRLCLKCIVRSSIFQITPISFNILFHSIHTKVNKYVPKKPAIMTIRPQVLLFSLNNYHISCSSDYVF